MAARSARSTAASSLCLTPHHHHLLLLFPRGPSALSLPTPPPPPPLPRAAHKRLGEPVLGGVCPPHSLPTLDLFKGPGAAAPALRSQRWAWRECRNPEAVVAITGRVLHKAHRTISSVSHRRGGESETDRQRQTHRERAVDRDRDRQ